MSRLRTMVVVAVALASVARLDPAHARQTTKLITVDRTADEVDAKPGDGVCAVAGGGCTLRAAIQETNYTPGPDTIVLPAGTYTLTIAGRDEDDAVAGDLDIVDSLTISGAGSATTIVETAAQLSDRIFDVLIGDVKFAGVTIRNGAPFNANNQRTAGGGIAHRSTRLTLVDVVMQDNLAAQGGALWSSGGKVLVKDSVFERNITAAGGVLDHNGGAMFLAGGSLTVLDSTLRDNHASAGGAVSVAVDGYATLIRTTIASNTARPFFNPCAGGGIHNRGTTSIVQSVIRGNATGNAPTGCDGSGGGIWNSGTLRIENTTISGNRAVIRGGAIFNEPSPTASVSVRHATIFGNDAPVGGGLYNGAVFDIVNSLVAGNTDGAANASDCSGTLSFLGPNLVQSVAGCTINGIAATNIAGVDATVGPLADNGGPTATHALLPGSPAIDAADDMFCPKEDQRSTIRPLDGNGDGSARCDIGAFELQRQTVELVAATEFRRFEPSRKAN